MIKLVAIDIDGTLVNEEKVMTGKVKKAIHEANDQGIKIVLCTGRPIEGIHPYLDELDFESDEDYVISHNGARIIRTDTMEVVEERALQLQDLKDIYSFCKDYPAKICALNEEHFYLLAGEMDSFLEYEEELINMEIEKKNIEDFTEDSKMLKVVCMGTEEEMDVLDSVIPEEMRERFYVVRSQKELVEILVKDTHKGTAIKNLASHLGLSMDEVMAIGDGENDYEMIEAAGLGVVMENGTERLKGIANEITLSNEEDGVAHAFEKWVLNQNA